VDAFQTTAYLINHLPSPILNNKSPYEKLLKIVFGYDHMRVFCYTCYPYSVPYNNFKLALKSKACVFLGFSSTYKGYLCFDTVNNKVYTILHVLFDETSFLYAGMNPLLPIKKCQLG
jgi:hypothetical protein